ncbi:hypothetical protein LZZ85_12995 [Terrimonas sp. NA20]|uniref:Uncharacterized protein n=1 Tax=Terrimonas ginsenosidimutans TaxID=2908004 RepID=A0ABS9KSG1_9BACT|nr:hypothetical protein [Terrimonas ginsenosidimutans]MCG2615210.1 hypothetical protein [Terrimonas ginsenosidimutans]
MRTGFAETEPRGILWNYNAKRVNNGVPGIRVIVVAPDIPGNERVLEITV